MTAPGTLASSLSTSTRVVINPFVGTTCPRYFHTSGSPSATGSNRAAAPHSLPTPRNRIAHCSSCTSASMPSEPGCTGSCMKCAWKNQSAAATSFSARTRPNPASPASGHQPVTRSSIISGSSASAAPTVGNASRSAPRNRNRVADALAKYSRSVALGARPAWFANASPGKNPNEVSIVATTRPASRASTRKPTMIIVPSSDQFVSSVRTRSVPSCGRTSSLHVSFPSRLRKKISVVCAPGSRA